MENKTIQLILGENVTVDLSSDTPNIQDIIEKIVNNKEILNVDEIKVMCKDEDNFDKEGFEAMIKEVIAKFLQTLKLEEINYEQRVK